MWKELTKISSTEKNCGVLQGLLGRPLSILADYDEAKVEKLVKMIFERDLDPEGRSKVHEQCASIFGRLYIGKGISSCGEILLNAATNPLKAPSVVQITVPNIRDALTYGSVETVDPSKDEIRRKAFDLLEKILSSADQELKKINRKNVGLQQWLEEDVKNAQYLLGLMDSVGTQLCFCFRGIQRKTRERSSNSG
jgi:hypothetical protein